MMFECRNGGTACTGSTHAALCAVPRVGTAHPITETVRSLISFPEQVADYCSHGFVARVDTAVVPSMHRGRIYRRPGARRGGCHKVYPRPIPYRPGRRSGATQGDQAPFLAHAVSTDFMISAEHDDVGGYSSQSDAYRVHVLLDAL